MAEAPKRHVEVRLLIVAVVEFANSELTEVLATQPQQPSSVAEIVAQEVGKQHARLGIGLDRAAVELEADTVTRIGTQARHRRASSMVARPSRRTSARR